ncbi:class II aldolase/adducin family protein [Raineyella sp.]|uniref:3-oxo-tetronate 4-phosphate decarboxylase n=1 Tax=bioreactor metagenome TaxID=1076179 RepID=A0A645CUC8_9ZZZZ|nr:class II aldolase/adducin family protein [Raineyella sp.]MEA5155023.1 class II aldolase/adducin family protein [Raineyella sp.]
MDETTIREQICQVGRWLWQKGMVAANDGNISVRLGQDRIICTPTGVSKAMMDADLLPIVTVDGDPVDDRALPPSSEIKMHLAVYREDPSVGAVVHAHPLYATMWAVAGQPISARMLPETVVTMPQVPLAPYATPSTQAVPDSVVPLVAGNRACLLENHGALTWGHDLLSAYLMMERLEYTAQLTWHLSLTGRGRDLPDAEVTTLRTLFAGA